MAQLRTTRMPDLWWLSNNVVDGEMLTKKVEPCGYLHINKNPH